MNRAGGSTLYLTFVVGLLLNVAAASGGPILTLPPGISPGALSISTYATGLSYPYSMQVLPDQSLLAGGSAREPQPEGATKTQ